MILLLILHRKKHHKVKLLEKVQKKNPDRKWSLRLLLYRPFCIRAWSDFVIKHRRNDSISQSGKLLLSKMQQHQAMKRSYSMDTSQKLHVSITNLRVIHLAMEDGKLKGFPGPNEARVSVSSNIDLEDGKSRIFCSVDEAQVGASFSVQCSNSTLEQNLATEMSCASSKALNKQYGSDRNKSTMKRSFSGGSSFLEITGEGMLPST